MKLQLPKTFTKFLFIAVLFVGQVVCSQETTLFNFSGTSGYLATPDTGWTSTSTAGGSYLKMSPGSVVSPLYTALVFKYDIAAFGSGSTNSNTKLTVLSETNVVISEYTLTSASSGTYIPDQTVAVGDVATSFKIKIEGLGTGANSTSTRGTRLRNYSLVGTEAVTGPTVTTVAASSVNTNGADLNGIINANGVSTDASFEYGTTAAYGSTATATPSTATGTSATSISATVGSLSLNTEYHYRAVGTVSAVPTDGNDMTFYTLAAIPGVLVVDNALQTTLDVTVDGTTENSNPAATEYAIQETGGQYVQGDGSLGATAGWQTAAAWTTVTVTGLTTSTAYTFSAKARNGANVETAFGGTVSGTTAAEQTVDMVIVQSPNTTQNINEGSDLLVSIRANEPGLTTLSGEQTNLFGWVGYSSTNDNPANAGWTWVAAVFDAEYGSDDQYQATLTGLAVGTYYYAARFQIGTGPFVYGGSVGVWNNDNVMLTINALGTPTATAGTAVGSTTFTANWDAVTDATSYEIDVYEQTNVVATDLFISEYVEGSSNNKYIEIYNGTGTSVDLSDYELQVFNNGSSTVSTTNVLSGTLTNGATMVYSNSGATIYGGATTDASAVGYNGDDAVALYKISTTSFVDVFGRIGNDPGTQWTGSGGYSTLDKTLVRKSNVSGGVTVSPTGTDAAAFTTLTTEWDLYNQDTVSNLGSHTFSGGSTATYVLNDFNVGNVTSYEVTGLNPETTYYYRVRGVLGGNTSANSNEITVTTKPTSVIWNGTAWSNGTGPDENLDAIIAGPYVTGDDGEITAKSLTINSGGSLTISSRDTVTVVEGFTNTLSAADVVVESGANLWQTGIGTNTGAITVKRNSNPLIVLDYTLWSSPVLGQGLYDFSKFTINNRFYVYNPTTNNYSNNVGFNMTGLTYPTPLVAPNGVNGADSNNVPFILGKGYLIRLPYNYTSTPTIFEGVFAGVPNNGDQTTPVVADTFNAIGNPYPSTMLMSQFATDNAANIEKTLYFWRKTNNAASPSYCTWNAETETFSGNGEANTEDPLGILQVGQGFIVKALPGVTAVNFNNSQRIADNVGGQFFKTTTNEANRIWLNLTGAGATFSQTVVGYFTNSTLAVESTDSKLFNDGPITLSSKVDDVNLVIQGRPVPFDATDVVALNYKVTTAGAYTIAIDHIDGLFAGAQDIYLRDAITGVDHDLKAGAYSFTTEAGNFGNRFFVVYTAALSVENPVLNANAIVVYKNDNQSFTVNSGSVTMASVKVFDIRGRLITSQNNINANQTTITAGQSNEVLLVQVTSIDGATVTKKVVR